MRLLILTAMVCLAIKIPKAQADLSNGSCTDAQSSKVVTTHTALIAGQPFTYSTTAGFLEVLANDRTTKACVFYTAYEVLSPKTLNRPLTFAFNGGPGSSSVWLHLGLLGPKRVDMGPQGLTPPRSPALIPNDSSLLPITDLVMIDPVATGFSNSIGAGNNDKFFGVKNDYTSIAEFVRNYLNSTNRWLSPKFILGESYGGIRGSLLTNYLQNNMNIRIDGLILISPALSKTTFFGTPDNLVPYWTYFPSFAATAWFHHKIAPQYQQWTVDEVFKRAQLFANSRLKNALDLGDDLPEQELREVAQQVADFSGFPVQSVLAQHLRIEDFTVFSRLLADQNRGVGRYDSRFTQIITGKYEDDPSGALAGFAYAAGINNYLRGDLNVQFQAPYNIFGEITSWNEGPDQSWDAISSMTQALSVNPQLKIFIASGYYDLACPMEGVSYVLRQLPNAALFKPRIVHASYDGGHMMYINPEALKKLSTDLSGFIKGQSQQILRPATYKMNPLLLNY